MFKRLKIKFVLVNMSLLTFVFLGIFIVIYALITKSVQEEINMILEASVRGYKRNIRNEFNLGDNFRNNNEKGSKLPIPPGGLGSLVVLIDENYGVLDFNKTIDVDEETIDDFIEMTIEEDSVTGNVDIEGTRYAYLKENLKNKIMIVYVDRSIQQNTIFLFLKIFVLVSVISLIILFMISLWFANKTIKPIKDVFVKQRQFIADASHELKTPLTIIKTNTAIIMGNSNEKVKEQEKWIGYINSQVDRMTQLIGDMISLAKIDDKNEKVNLIEFNMSELLKSSLLAFEAIFYESELTLNARIMDNVYIVADNEAIKKLMNVLIDNAIKYTPSNNEIYISLKADKNKVTFKIRNSGVEIPKDYIEKIFERFYRPDDSRAKEGGNGLGLSIAKSIVKNHKGKIGVRSGYNYTLFKFEIPLNYHRSILKK